MRGCLPGEWCFLPTNLLIARVLGLTNWFVQVGARNLSTGACAPSEFSKVVFQRNQAAHTTECNREYAACGGNCVAMHTCPP